MARRKNTPEWKKTNVGWDTEVLIWSLMAKGLNDTQVGKFLDTQRDPLNNRSTLSLDRSTIAKVRIELSFLPKEHLTKLSPEIIRFRSELRIKQISDKCPHQEIPKILKTQKWNNSGNSKVPVVDAMYPDLTEKSNDAVLHNHDYTTLQEQTDIVTVSLDLMDFPKQILGKFYGLLKTVS
jgi:hypothetical protein